MWLRQREGSPWGLKSAVYGVQNLQRQGARFFGHQSKSSRIFKQLLISGPTSSQILERTYKKVFFTWKSVVCVTMIADPMNHNELELDVSQTSAQNKLKITSCFKGLPRRSDAFHTSHLMWMSQSSWAHKLRPGQLLRRQTAAIVLWFYSFWKISLSSLTGILWEVWIIITHKWNDISLHVATNCSRCSTNDKI